MFFNQYPYINLNDLNLDFLLKNYKKLLQTLESIDGWIDQHEEEYNELKAQIDALETGNWSPEFINSLNDYYRNNIVNIIGELANQVFFGITDDGYFVAYIPESWDDITFGTSGLDDFPAGIEYGHLTLTY